MTGYELTNRMRKTRRRHPLTASEQALYHELVAICNDDEWPDTFSCSNEELCAALGISENTLNASRNRLIQVGLIFYKSGKSKRVFSTYSFTKKLTTSKFDTNTATNIDTNTGVDAEGDAATNAADYNKHKVKPNKKNITAPNGTAPVKDKKAKKKEESVTEFWQPLVEQWFRFYRNEFHRDPSFEGPETKALKKILDRLKDISIKAGKASWTKEYAHKVFDHFLTKAYADKWRKENFMLHILSMHFDAIISKNENKTSSDNQTDDYLEQRRKIEERTRKLSE